MLFQTSPFEERAAFLRRNVCDFPAGPTRDKIESAGGEEIFEGLQYIRQLLLDIYADTAAYRAEDDLESYHRLTQTILLLYAAGIYGELTREGEVSFLRFPKPLIRKHFKKPAAFHLDALQNYGFYFAYFKNGRPVQAYPSCDTVCMYNESCPSFFPALAYLACRIPAMDSKKDFAMQSDLFLRADFETILLGGGKRKEDIDPLRPEIIRTLGPKAEWWKELMHALADKQSLKASCKFWSYCAPNWTIHLTAKGKTVCIFTLYIDSMFFEWSAPYEAMVQLAREKEQMPPAIRQCLENFGCIRCGRCGGESITLVNGVSLCTREAWARRITFDIADKTRVQAVSRLVFDK